MKKFSLISLAIASALMISPAMLVGQSTTFNWSASSNGLVGSGTITATPDGSVAGAWDVTGITGTFANSNTSLGNLGFSGNVIGLTGYINEDAVPSYSSSNPSGINPTLYYQYDDLLYLAYTSPSININGYPGNGGGQFDPAGLVFNVQTTSGVYEVEIFQDGSTTSAFVVNPDGSYDGSNNYGITASNFSVPEGGTALLYLLLSGAGCFGAIFFRSRSGAGSPALA
jgi:hypothetical protein